MLTAEHALSSSVIKVSEDMHARNLGLAASRCEAYAVFTNPDTVSSSTDFLGMVSQQKAIQYPLRIFADLLPPPLPVSAEEQTPLTEVFERFHLQQLEILPVVTHKRVFLGAITRHSLLETLLNHERHRLTIFKGDIEEGKQVLEEDDLFGKISSLEQRRHQETDRRAHSQEHINTLNSAWPHAVEPEPRQRASDAQSYIDQLLKVIRFKISQACEIAPHPSGPESHLQEIDRLFQELIRALSPQH